MVALISPTVSSVKFDPLSCIDCHYSLTAYDLSMCVHACIVRMHRSSEAETPRRRRNAFP